MKRIFIIENSDIGSGLPLSVYLTSFLKNLKEDKNLEYNLIVSKSKSIPDEIKKKLNKIYELNTSLYKIKDNFKFSFQAYSILKKENRKKKIDTLHCFYPNSSLLGAVLFKKTVNKHVKIIYDVRSPWIEMIFARKHVNGIFSKLIKNFLHKEEKQLVKSVDSFVFISQGLKEYYFDKYRIKNKPFVIIPSGVDTKLFTKKGENYRKKLGYSKEDILIGHIGTLCRSRKILDFMVLFKEASTKDPNLRLLFIGEGNDKENLKKYVKENNLTKVVRFIEPVPHKDIPKYIRAFDYGLCHLPDEFVYRNSFPLKILEYLACGVPVLASDMKAHREIGKGLNNILIYSNELVFDYFYKLDKQISLYNWNSLGIKYCRGYLQ